MPLNYLKDTAADFQNESLFRDLTQASQPYAATFQDAIKNYIKLKENDILARSPVSSTTIRAIDNVDLARIHNDGKNLPTFGYGLNLAVGRESTDAVKKQAAWDRTRALIEHAFGPLDLTEITALDWLEEWFFDRDVIINGAPRKINALEIIDAAQGKAGAPIELSSLTSLNLTETMADTMLQAYLFGFTSSGGTVFTGQNDLLTTALTLPISAISGSPNGQNVLDSVERVALLAAFINAETLIGYGLRSALARTDSVEARAEAWYQLIYKHQNTDPLKPTDIPAQARRSEEASLFGLISQLGINPADIAVRVAAHKKALNLLFNGTEANSPTTNIYDTIEARDGIETFPAIISTELDYLRTQLSLPAGFPIDMVQMGDIQANSITGKTSTDNPTSTANLIFGEGGDDIIDGGAGNDALFGGAGNDTLAGEAGNDILNGGDFGLTPGLADGEDTVKYSLDGAGIIANLQDGTVTDGNGDTDTLISIERVLGSTFDDTFKPDLSEDGAFVGDLGKDTIDYSGAASGVTVDLGAGTGSISGGPSQTLTDIEKIIASPFADILQGSDAGGELKGGGGGDTVRGGGGADRLYGGAGSDDLDGGAEADTLYGDDDAAESDTLTGGTGTDSFRAGANDVISDLARDDAGVSFDGVRLGGGKEDKNNPGTYVGNSGETYEWAGSGDLIVTLNGNTITIQDFVSGSGKIILKSAADDIDDTSAFVSPLVLDLDGDGIELIDLNFSGAFFDLDQDGFSERTGWVAPDDGLLVLDRNLDGVINDVSELFGAGYISPSISVEEAGDELRGFETLRALDVDGDGFITAADPGFASLQIWQDADGDGYSLASELHSLTDLGIQSIALDSFESDSTVAGNLITEASSFVRTDTTTGTIADVYFSYDPSSTVDRATETLAIDADIRALPYLKGFGEVVDLDIAMQQDPTLKALVQELVAMTAADADQLASKVESIIFRWFGVENVSAEGRGLNIDGQRLAVLEKLTGFPFMQGGRSPDPRSQAGASLRHDWGEFFSATMARLMGQTPIGNTLIPGLNFEGGAFLTIAGAPALQSVLDNLAVNSPGSTIDRLRYWHGMVQVLESLRAEFAETTAQFDAKVSSALAAHGIEFTRTQLLEGYFGADGGDVIVGSKYFGGEILLGGSGDDILDGRGGADIYLFGSGMGSDIIRDRSIGASRIKFLDQNFADLSFRIGDDPLGHDLVIEIMSTGESLTIKNQLSAALGLRPVIGQIEFADGSTTDWLEIAADISFPTAGDDVLVGQRDTLNVLDGGAGNDFLIGRNLDDTFLFGPGSGSDHILESDINANSVDRVVFGSGFNVSDLDVSLTEFGALSVDFGTSDFLTIERQYAYSNPQIENFEFSDGTILTAANLLDLAMAGTAGDETILGTVGDNRIDGAGGNDLLRGLEGNDTYVFGPGSGRDTIDDAGGANIVELAAGITTADVSLQRVGSIGDVILQLAGASDTLTVKGFGARQSTSVQEIRFADGTIWDRATIEAQIPIGTVTGGETDDYYDGIPGADIVNLGGGVDYALLGSSDGDDTIVFGRGNDIDVYELSGSTPFRTVEFEPGITRDDLVVSLGPSSGFGSLDAKVLIITIKDTGDQLQLDRAAYIDQYRFADGQVLTPDQFMAPFFAGTDGDDIVGGAPDGFVFDLGAGNDVAVTSTNSVFVFGRGSGQDRIFSSKPTIIRFAAGVALADLEISIDEWGQVNVTISDTGDKLIIMRDGALSRFEFDDGTVLATQQDILNAAYDQMGTSGDDMIYGENKDSVLDGGAGNDTLIGSLGDDTYIFGPGSGQDTIIDDNFWGGQDVGVTRDGVKVIDYGKRELSSVIDFANRLRITGGLTQADVQFTVDGRDLIVTIISTQESARIVNQFNPDLVRAGVDLFEFDDGTVLARADVEAPLRIVGGEADFLLGTSIGEVLAGGLGDDRLEGRQGDDIYQFNLGDGQDQIVDSEGVDKIVFGAGLDLADLSVQRNPVGEGIELSFIAAGDSVTVEGGIESFEFADGSVRSLGELSQLVIDSEVSSADDVVDSLSGNLVVDALGGNDTIHAKTDNIILFGIGSGNDTIASGDASNIVRFGVGIQTSDLILERIQTPTGGDDLVIRIDGTSDTLTLKAYFDDGFGPLPAYASPPTVGSFEFDDGTVWSKGDLQAALMSSSVTSRNDTIFGTDGDDVIDGGLGNDVLLGGSGNDTYLFGRGSGNDKIDEAVEFLEISDAGWLGLDRVLFAVDILPSDVVFSADRTTFTATISDTGDTLSLSFVQGDWSAIDVETFEFADGTILNSADLIDQLSVATTGDDLIRTTINNYYSLQFDGGAGNDTYMGSDYSDTYVFGIGSGTDTIVEGNLGVRRGLENEFGNATFQNQSDPDQVLFGAGVAVSDLDFLRTGTDLNDLLIRIRSTGDTLIIEDQFAPYDGVDFNLFFDNFSDQLRPFRPDGQAELSDLLADDLRSLFYGASGVEEFVFDDGTTLTRGDVSNLISGSELTPGDNTITTDLLGGTLDGGSGNDNLLGGTGDDTYVFDRGFAQDQILDAGGYDVIQFGANMSLPDVTFIRTGNAGQDLRLEVGGLEFLTLTIVDQFASDSSRIESFDFADGTKLTWTEVQDLIIAAQVTEGSDIVTAFDADDFVSAGGGDDTITGGKGDDTILGDTGIDTAVFSGLQSDYDVVISGNMVTVTDLRLDGDGIDTLYDVEFVKFNGDQTVVNVEPPLINPITVTGTGGADVIDVLNGIGVPVESTPDTPHIIFGLGGDDLITGGNVNDVIKGSSGNDTLDGGAGDDVFEYSGTGLYRDTVDGGLGFDVLQGSSGDDIFTLGSFSNIERIDGGAGYNEIKASSGVDNWDFSGVELLNIDKISSGGSADTITGSAGDDVIDAGTGNDTVYGSAGIDVIKGGSGNDTLDGGAGDDVFEYSGTGLYRDTVDGGAGFDVLQGSSGNDTFTLGSFTNIERIDGGLGYNEIKTSGGVDNWDFSGVELLNIDKISSGGSSDTITGSAGNDVIDAGSGNDTVYGSAGIDVIKGGSGNDTLDGGAGDDVFEYSGTGLYRDTVDGGAGFDLLQGSSGNDTFTLGSFTNIERIDGGLGYNEIKTSGGVDNWDFSGVELLNIDKISSGGSADTITGSAGNDVIDAGSGDDTVNGSAGNDAIDGKTGIDTVVYAGLRADYLIVDNGASSFTVTDLRTGAPDGIDTLANVEFATFADQTLDLTSGILPVVLDLDGDGIELVGLSESRVFLDADEDGRPERVGWVGADDGILAYDENGNGRVDGLAEISLARFGEGASTDLEGLRAFDTNADGYFDQGDEAFASFGVWQDGNQNGRYEEGEYTSLSDAGIARIALTSSSPAISEVDGNTIHGLSYFERIDGTHGIVGDVELGVRELPEISANLIDEIREFFGNFGFFGESGFKGSFATRGLDGWHGWKGLGRALDLGRAAGLVDVTSGRTRRHDTRERITAIGSVQRDVLFDGIPDTVADFMNGLEFDVRSLSSLGISPNSFGDPVASASVSANDLSSDQRLIQAMAAFNGDGLGGFDSDLGKERQWREEYLFAQTG